MTPTFQGEVQFRRWSDSSTQGVQVTFALPDSDALDPLKGMEGKRFMAVLVEIGDDEQPVEPAKSRPKDTRGPKCREACDLCADRQFQFWVAAAITGVPPEAERGISTELMNEHVAKSWLLKQCGGIQSRKQLDEDVIAGELFITRVRVPFAKWLRAQS